MTEQEQGVDAVDEDRIGYSPEIDWTQWDDGRIHTLCRVGSRSRRPRGASAETFHLDAFEQPAVQARRAFLSWASRWKVGTHSSVVDENTLKVQVTPTRPTRKPRGKRRARSTPVTSETCEAGA